MTAGSRPSFIASGASCSCLAEINTKRRSATGEWSPWLVAKVRVYSNSGPRLVSRDFGENFRSVTRRASFLHRFMIGSRKAPKSDPTEAKTLMDELR